jgi:hypothetical protein
MTKTRLFAAGGGRDHVADLDLFVGDHHTVDQEFDQVPFLFEARLLEPTAHPLAEFLHRLGSQASSTCLLALASS